MTLCGEITSPLVIVSGQFVLTQTSCIKLSVILTFFLSY